MIGQKPTLGFIGTGLMGKPMASRLLDAGYQLSVWNRTPDKLDELITQGAIPAKSPLAVAEQADIIMLSLADTQAVEQVIFTDHGLHNVKGAGKLLVDFSSIEPEATRQFALRLKQQTAMEWLDAPVSGGVAGAEQGTLAIMAGGLKENFTRVVDVMQCLSQRFTYMGEVGAGQVTKVCNQMIVSCNALVIAEVIALAKKSGIDAAKISEALMGGFADSKPLQMLGPQMASNTFEPIKWHVRTLLKDLDIAALVAKNAASATPMSALGAQLMRQHASKGFAEKDPATLVKLYEQ